MKQDLHPIYYPKTKVTCACGNTWHVGSTAEDIRINVCSKCHPFYTGTEKIVDTRGRVEKYQKRVAAAKKPATKATKKSEK